MQALNRFKRKKLRSESDGGGCDERERGGSGDGRSTPRGGSLSVVFQQRSGAKRSGDQAADAQRWVRRRVLTSGERWRNKSDVLQFRTTSSCSGPMDGHRRPHRYNIKYWGQLGQVTIIFVVSVCLSVCLFVCAEFFSAVFDPISIKLGHYVIGYVWV